MSPRRDPDDLDRMLDRLEEAATVVTAVFQPKVTVTMSKGAFVVEFNWTGAIDYDASPSTTMEIQHALTELEQHIGSAALPTKITIPRG